MIVATVFGKIISIFIIMIVGVICCKMGIIDDYTKQRLSRLGTLVVNPILIFTSFQMEYEAKQYYPGFSRCIYLKGYRYNLHLRPRSVLLEVGAQTNTVEEVKNAMGPFADILHKVLSGKSPASGG